MPSNLTTDDFQAVVDHLRKDYYLVRSQTIAVVATVLAVLGVTTLAGAYSAVKATATEQATAIATEEVSKKVPQTVGTLISELEAMKGKAGTSVTEIEGARNRIKAIEDSFSGNLPARVAALSEQFSGLLPRVQGLEQVQKKPATRVITALWDSKGERLIKTQENRLYRFTNRGPAKAVIDVDNSPHLIDLDPGASADVEGMEFRFRLQDGAKGEAKIEYDLATN